MKEAGKEDTTKLGMLQRRFGRFSISAPFLQRDPEVAIEMFSKLEVIVLRCEHIFHLHEFQYVGMSTHFRALDPGEETPFYQFIFSKDEDGVVHLDSVEEIENRWGAQTEDDASEDAEGALRHATRLLRTKN